MLVAHRDTKARGRRPAIRRSETHRAKSRVNGPIPGRPAPVRRHRTHRRPCRVVVLKPHATSHRRASNIRPRRLASHDRSRPRVPLRRFHHRRRQGGRRRLRVVRAMAKTATRPLGGGSRLGSKCMHVALHERPIFLKRKGARSVRIGSHRFASVRIGSHRFASVRIGSHRFASEHMHRFVNRGEISRG